MLERQKRAAILRTEETKLACLSIDLAFETIFPLGGSETALESRRIGLLE